MLYDMCFSFSTVGYYIALDSASVSTSTTLAGAAGVAARFFEAFLLLDRRLGVLERRADREARREVERLDFLERGRLEAEREEDRREEDRRLAARRFELFGVRDLRELLFFEDGRREVERVELRRDEALEDDFLGAFGVLARRTERRFADFDVEAERTDVRRLEPLGALALRRTALRRLSDVRERLLEPWEFLLVGQNAFGRIFGKTSVLLSSLSSHHRLRSGLVSSWA